MQKLKHAEFVCVLNMSLKIPMASNIWALILQRQANTFVFKIFPGPPHRHILANNNECDGVKKEKKDIKECEIKSRQSVLHIHEAVRMSWWWKPSAIGLSALLSTYCLMTLLTHWYNNNNANDSNNVIMHRHPPTEGQYAAYNSAADNGITAQAPWRAAGLAAVYRAPLRPRHTHTVFSLWFCSVSRLYQQGPCSFAKAPLNPASSPTLLLFACGDFGSWLRGPCARDKTHFTALDGAPQTLAHMHMHSVSLVHQRNTRRLSHVWSHLCRKQLWLDRRGSSETRSNSMMLRNKRKATTGDRENR